MTENRKTQYGVPRRFGVGTILVVTTAFAVLFAVLNSMGASPTVVSAISGFVLLVGVGQMWLFGGKNPRAASIWMGGISLPVFFFLFPRTIGISLGELALGLIGCLLLGLLLGYLAGLSVGGVFLIMDAVEKTFFGDRVSSLDAEVEPDSNDPLGEE